MAVKAGVFVEEFESASRPTTTFSGVVIVDGIAAIRELYGYKYNNPEILFKTKSDALGNWSLTIPLGSTETVRIICVGAAGENSKVYEHLTEY